MRTVTGRYYFQTRIEVKGADQTRFSLSFRAAKNIA